ncbi:hypothetical protein ABZP36_016046 [Zizania latifolia]
MKDKGSLYLSFLGIKVSSVLPDKGLKFKMIATCVRSLQNNADESDANELEKLEKLLTNALTDTKSKKACLYGAVTDANMFPGAGHFLLGWMRQNCWLGWACLIAPSPSARSWPIGVTSTAEKWTEADGGGREVLVPELGNGVEETEPTAATYLEKDELKGAEREHRRRVDSAFVRTKSASGLHIAVRPSRSTASDSSAPEKKRRKGRAARAVDAYPSEFWPAFQRLAFLLCMPTSTRARHVAPRSRNQQPLFGAALYDT